MPHSSFVVPPRQLPVASQHPVRQVVEQSPDAHDPATHVWFPVHATQAAPLRPQVALDVGVMHMVPEQQPFAQLVELQLVPPPWHMPLTHAWPPEQATHEAPFEPQAAELGVRQVLFASQQPPQDPGPQTAMVPPPAPAAPVPPPIPPTPPTPPPAPLEPPVPVPVPHFPEMQDWPAGQRVHAAAPTPHAAGSRPSWHWPLSSQQPEQLEVRQRGVLPHAARSSRTVAARTTQRAMTAWLSTPLL